MGRIEGVKRYQITQLEDGGFEFKLVLESEERQAEVEAEIKARMGRRFGIRDVRILTVPAITPEPSGKIRYIRSKAWNHP